MRHSAKPVSSEDETWITYNCQCGKRFSSPYGPYGGEACKKWMRHCASVLPTDTHILCDPTSYSI